MAGYGFQQHHILVQHGRQLEEDAEEFFFEEFGEFVHVGGVLLSVVELVEVGYDAVGF